MARDVRRAVPRAAAGEAKGLLRASERWRRGAEQADGERKRRRMRGERADLIEAGVGIVGAEDEEEREHAGHEG